MSRHTGGTPKYVCVTNVPLNLIINSHKCSALGPEVLATSVHLVCNCLVSRCTLRALSFKGCCTETCPLDLANLGHSIPIVSSTVGSDGTSNKTDLGVVSEKDSHDSLLEEECNTLKARYLSDTVSEVSDKDCEPSKVGGAPIDDTTDGHTDSKT